MVYRLTDQMLTGAILCIINAVIANPTLIESDSEISSYKPNGEIIIKQNEINRLIDDPYSDTEQVKTEIFRLAEMKYDRCTYSDITPKTELIKSLVSDMEQLNSLDAEFMKLVIKRITVSHYSSVEAEFIKATPHKERLTALQRIYLHIFRHLAHKFFDIRQYACKISAQSAEKSDCVSAPQSLCGVALTE